MNPKIKKPITHQQSAPIQENNTILIDKGKIKNPSKKKSNLGLVRLQSILREMGRRDGAGEQ